MAAAAAKWLQSCPTLCDPIDSSSPGSPVPGILQARTLEWVAISGVTGKFGLGVQNEAGQSLIVLPIELTGHSKHPLPTTQEKTLHMDITRFSTPKLD